MTLRAHFCDMADAAAAFVDKEVAHLLEQIRALGTTDAAGQVSCPFGVLFSATVDVFEVSSAAGAGPRQARAEVDVTACAGAPYPPHRRH